jgi:hypothetical protein
LSSWTQLEAALDAAARRGETIRLWWRDDDAGRDHPALYRLLDLAERHSTPLALAVVPAWLEPPAQGMIAGGAQVTVLQHGFAHANHAKKPAKPIELGGREAEAVLDELRQGFGILEDAFGSAFLPVLVPPWNRIDAVLFPFLERSGYRGLSVYGPRSGLEVAPGVRLLNTHLDPVDWHGTRGFIGEEAALDRLIDILHPDEPVGVLSHHLDMDESGWTFFDDLFTVLGRHPAARLCPAPYLFERAAPRPEEPACADRYSGSTTSRSTFTLPRAGFGRSTASASRCRPARRWPWSAKAAPARRSCPRPSSESCPESP